MSCIRHIISNKGIFLTISSILAPMFPLQVGAADIQINTQCRSGLISPEHFEGAAIAWAIKLNQEPVSVSAIYDKRVTAVDDDLVGYLVFLSVRIGGKEEIKRIFVDKCGLIEEIF